MLSVNSKNNSIKQGIRYIPLLICLFIIISGNRPSMAVQIHSSVSGGNWTQPSTWIGGIVPAENDTVIINGTIDLDVNATCKKLIVSAQGILRNIFTTSYKITVTGDCYNYGTIMNNGSKLVLYISGNVIQSGSWSNLHTILNGSGDQHIWFDAVFSGQYITKYNTTGKLMVHTGLEFSNTIIDINNDTLLFIEGEYLKITSGFLDQAVVIKDPVFDSGNFDFEMQNGACYQKTIITADTIRLKGTIQFQSAPVNFNGTIILTGLLQNYPTSTYNAVMNGNFINHGSVSRNLFGLNLQLKGDWINSGNWNTSTITLSGTGNQTIRFTVPVKTTQIMNLKPSGTIFADGSFTIQNTLFNLSADTLVFISGNGMTLKGSTLQSGVIKTTPASDQVFKLDMQDNSMLEQCCFITDSLWLTGIFQAKGEGNELNADVVNSGTMQNCSGYDGTVIMNGNFLNEGTVRDNLAKHLSVVIDGNIIHRGVWSNTTTCLMAAMPRNLYFGNSFAGDAFVVTGGPDTLFVATDLIFNGTSVNMDSAVLKMPSYCKFHIYNGSLERCLFSAEKLEFAVSDSGSCSRIRFPSVDIYGQVFLHGDIEVNGDLTLWGSMQNYPGDSVEINMMRSLTNHGSFSGNNGSLQIRMKENVYNNGTFDNCHLFMNGSEDQRIELQNGNSIDSDLCLNISVGNTFEWFRNGSSLIGQPDFVGADSSSLVFPAGVDETFTGIYQCLTDAGWLRHIVIDTLSNYHELDLRILLQGAYDGSEMNCRLNELGYLPMGQSYSLSPWYYPGDEEVTALPNQDIVDWLLIELKDASNPEVANKTTIFERKAVFLLKDGTIADLDGSSYPGFAHTMQHGLYIDILHRNHLDIMSADSLSHYGNTYILDFTADVASAYDSSLSNLGNAFGMISGDANPDGRVDQSDKESGWNIYAGFKTEYRSEDLNLDGQIDNRDKNDCWLGNMNKMVTYPK